MTSLRWPWNQDHWWKGQFRPCITQSIFQRSQLYNGIFTSTSIQVLFSTAIITVFYEPALWPRPWVVKVVLETKSNNPTPYAPTTLLHDIWLFGIGKDYSVWPKFFLHEANSPQVFAIILGQKYLWDTPQSSERCCLSAESVSSKYLGSNWGGWQSPTRYASSRFYRLPSSVQIEPTNP